MKLSDALNILSRTTPVEDPNEAVGTSPRPNFFHFHVVLGKILAFSHWNMLQIFPQAPLMRKEFALNPDGGKLLTFE